MTTYLIVNADDFGISAGVSRGILEAHHDGIVTSTTAMVNMPHAAESIRLAQEVAPHLGIGLHLNLSFGKPVQPPEEVSTLVTEDGSFVSTWDEVHAKSAGFEPSEVRAEFAAQMGRFIELAGRAPDHLDSHHAVSYWHLAGFEAMIELAAEHGIPIRSPEPLDEVREAIMERVGRPRWPQMIHHTPVFFDTGATLETLRSILSTLPDGNFELMCHPGYAVNLDELYAAPRERELQVLTDPAVRMLIADRSIRLISFGELP